MRRFLRRTVLRHIRSPPHCKWHFLDLPRCHVSLTRKVSLLQYTSDADSETMPPYTSFSFAGTVSLPVDTAATQGDGKHHASYDGIFPLDVK